MKPTNLLIGALLCFMTIHSHAQNHDHTWLFGAASPTPTGTETPPYSDTRIDFNFDPPRITIDPKPLILESNSVVTSDHDGNLVFYSNGKTIAGADHQTMANGTGLNPGDYASDVGSHFVTAPQGILTIPKPGDPDKYYIVHAPYALYLDIVEFFTFALMYTTVDMAENGGMGEVVAKNEVIVSDSLWLGKLTATKHANGRDWWILYNEWLTNDYYTVLITPSGPEVVGKQTVGSPVNDGLAQAVFSPDGTKFAVANALYSTYIQIFDFDRCTGLLSNETTMVYPQEQSILTPGLAISQNSRFMYFSATDTIYQYDLWADSIKASEEVVGVYDWNVDPFQNTFYLAQLAPDGKIYFSIPNGSNYLHVIDQPNKKGLDCNFKQRGIDLMNRNGFGLPNNPNYRLGPLDGSPCDTLGLDNVPVAKYRYDQDTVEYLQVEFTDLSYYEPAEWSWDFGDNTVSQDTSPVHTFPQDGAYEVCLTVHNLNGEHTYCRTLELGTVSSVEERGKVDITVFPNPCREGVNVIIGDYLPRDAKVVLYNAMGQRQKMQSVQTGWNTLHLDNFRPGIYFYEIWEGDVLLDSGKLIKVE